MGSGIMEWFELEVTFKIIYFQPPTIGKDATNVKILTILTPPPLPTQNRKPKQLGDIGAGSRGCGEGDGDV